MLTEKFTYFPGPYIPNKFLAFVENSSEVSIDLEADGLYHYFAKVCLIQLNVDDKIYIVDPLENKNTSMLFKAFGNKTLILHGGSYDLYLMRECYSFIPDKIFDTMIAAQILGLDKLSLANLVEKYFKVSLSKGPQKMDWSLRPLPDKMFDYSANDVKYLPKLKKILTKELKEKGRMKWMEENCNKLILAESYDHSTHSEEDFWRVKGSNSLDRKQLAYLRELWDWREKEAQCADVPVYKIMKNENLIELAVWCASENRSIFSWHSFDKYIKKRVRGEECEKARIRAKKLAPSKWPEKKHPTGSKGLGVEVNPIFFDKIKIARDKIAEELKMDSSVVLTQKLISKIAKLKEYDPDVLVDKFGLCVWQRDLIENDLIKIFAGEE